MKIVNWQKVLSFHQFYTWNSLEKLINNRILYIVTGYELDIRHNQGWSFPDLGEHDVINLSKHTWLMEGIRILESNQEAIHVFPSFWVERRYFPLILYSAIRQIRTVILVEPYSTEAAGYLQEEAKLVSIGKVKIRPPLYKIVSAFINRFQRSDHFCILAISTKARQQMLKAGFMEEQIFPFGYFVPKTQVETTVQNQINSKLRLVFIGTLIKRKGLDTALKAMRLVKSNGYGATLDIYGAGDPNTVSDSYPDCVRYRGSFPSVEAQNIISQYDVLLLPSRHDGWGVVVNEALLQGKPVIVSDQVGASVLVKNSGAGKIFESGDFEQLYNVIVDLIMHPEMVNQMKTNALQICVQITPDAAASYLQTVFQYYFQGEGKPLKVLWG